MQLLKFVTMKTPSIHINSFLSKTFYLESQAFQKRSQEEELLEKIPRTFLRSLYYFSY